MVQDKRSHPRVPLNTEITCEVSGGASIGGRAKDISIGGMFIDSEAQVAFGMQVTIVLRLPNTQADARLPGVIRWIKPGGFGVQFGLLGARDTHAISELFKS
ncbi:MAG TPA: PilZ domain-containing protein [Polyangiaceae bacterium]|nr:PilZ domain-containing protein [Polyangiaceae bacterium]